MRHSTGKGYFNSEIKHSFHVILYEKKNPYPVNMPTEQ